MKLRTQLLVISLLTLSLPWAGCQYVKQMEIALRQGQQDALLATARAVALLAENRQLLEGHNPPATKLAYEDIYADTINWPVFLDGYADDWDLLAEKQAPLPGTSGQPEASYIAARHNDNILLFISIDKEQFVFTQPGREQGDYIELTSLDRNGNIQTWVLASSGPGPMQASYQLAGDRRARFRREHLIEGALQQSGNTWQAEIRIPASLVHRHLGLRFIDSRRKALAAGNVRPPGRLVVKDHAAEEELSAFNTGDYRIRLTNRNGWVIAQPGNIDQEQPVNPDVTGEKPLPQAWMEHIYRAILESGNYSASAHNNSRDGLLDDSFYQQVLEGRPASDWVRQPGEQNLVLAAWPVQGDDGTDGMVVVEQPSDAILSITNDALVRLFNISFIAISLTVSALIGYASLLSWRIYRLRRSAEESVSTDGKISGNFRASSASDELGDLSRSFATLVDNIAGYNQYLETLASKLSHELRTPLAMVKSSLENMSHPSSMDVYLERAGQGIDRLQNIINSMSEASRLEQALQGTSKETVELAPLMENLVESYRQVYPSHRFRLEYGETTPATVMAAPELLMQLMDKLVSNAVDFSPADEDIVLGLSGAGENVEISVSNTGPLLPEEMKNHLFDSMVSIRDTKSDTPNLGLGLYVARLISDFHGGSIFAENRKDGSGVMIRLQLPAAKS